MAAQRLAGGALRGFLPQRIVPSLDGVWPDALNTTRLIKGLWC